MDLLQNHLNKIRNKRREYIICGSWFSAPRTEDLQNAQAMAAVYPALDAEQAWFETVFRELRYVDAFRRINSDDDEFTWWPDGDRSSNGWRADFQMVSNGLRHRVDYGAIYKSQAFSSHAPVIMDYESDL